MAKTQLTPRQIAKRLQDHHMNTCAGFYPSEGASRAFGARMRKGNVEITPDFHSWVPVNLETVAFRDHNGRTISLGLPGERHS